MIRSLFPIIILCNLSSASTTNITNLQQEFKKEVLELNVFKKRFGSYLTKNCADDLLCYRKTIKKLKSWETVQNDSKLQYFLKKKITHLQFDEQYWQHIIQKLHNKKIHLQTTQFVSVIDLEKQLYIVTLWNDQTKEFNFIGKDLISSGNINREKEVKFGEDHYLKTPSGVFKSKYGWRSDGKKSDDNITLGYGAKDRYVFYFGQQNTIRYNTFDKNKQKVYDPQRWQLITDKLEFAVHSHKSSKPMGKPYSHGCIRMTDELNRFLDNKNVLHKNVLKNGKWLHKYAKEPYISKYQNFAGEYLIIFDKI